MKKNLTALMLCLVSILFISWRNPFSSSTHTQNVTVKVSEEYADWTEVGTVQLNSNPYGGSPSTSNIIRLVAKLNMLYLPSLIRIIKMTLNNINGWWI